MEHYQRLCKNCGGDLHAESEGNFKCKYCGSIFETESVVSYADEMRRLFDEYKLEAISNARRNLYEAVNAEYISTTRVHECCVILKQLLPDDFQANFYETASGNNLRQISKAIRKINVEENFNYIESVIGFLIRSLQTAYQLELNNLIARAFEYRDPVKFEKYCTWLADEAVKTDSGVYEIKLPREVFVAYSSKDMDKVSELVEVLEAQGLKCFVAARNLRHGKGAVENYNAALEEAMDCCRSFVFVSSTNSRAFDCDALSIELPYLKRKDLENAPAEYKNNYKSIPQQYKKPRVEYRIGESKMMTAADTISNEIFDGYERAYTPDEVAERVMKQLVATPMAKTTPEKAPEPKKVKYCVSCQGECPEDAKFCMNCGGNAFANTVKEAELMAKIEELEDEKTSIAKNDEVLKPNKGTSMLASVGLSYELNNDEESYFVKGIGFCKDTDIVPYPSLYGKPITAIGTSAFEKCLELTSITIPDSVTSIGQSAFAWCENLTSITIPDSVTSIGDYAFKGCSKLTSITIPDSVTSIGEKVFYNCSSLASITIPDSVTSIGDYAFLFCRGFTSITIPDSVTSIAAGAFSGCESLTSITVDKKNNKYHNSENCLIETENKKLIAGCKNSIIPTDGSVTIIDDNAFSGCSDLTSITIPDGVTSIGNSAFWYCSKLTSITIPDSVTSIGESAFAWCKLNEVVFKNPIGWQKSGGGLFSKISEKVLSDPKKAAKALTAKYVNVTLERIDP